MILLIKLEEKEVSVGFVRLRPMLALVKMSLIC